MDGVLALVSQKLRIMTGAPNPDPIHFRRKAITALFLYAAQQKPNGQHEILDMFLCAARASKEQGFMWNCIKPLVPRLLDEDNPISLKQAIILALPHIPWWGSTSDNHLIQQWAAAALAIPYTKEIGHSVVDTLLQVASNHSL